MTTKSLMRRTENVPSIFEDLFKPWNEWFDNSGSNLWGKMMKVPAVNITDNKDNYLVSLAVPGMDKKDFNIDIDGNLLTISAEKEENKEEKETRYSRREYSYSSFSRSFTIPEEVLIEKIDATYENGLLKLVLPKKEDAKKPQIGKHIDVK